MARISCCGRAGGQAERARECRFGSPCTVDPEEEPTYEHRGDSGSAGDHANVLGIVGSVAHLTLGALDVDIVADLELAKVLRDVAGRVTLFRRVSC